MKIRGSVLAFALAIVALDVPSPTGAQLSGRTWRIGILSIGPIPGHAVFVQTLRQRGYVEGQNLTIVYRYAEGRAERIPQFASELVSAKVDVIVTAGTAVAIAAKKASGSIPIVAMTTDDPVTARLVARLARPEGNLTGVTLLTSELAGKRLEMLREILPRVSRVGILAAQDSDPQVEEMQRAARRLGIHIVQLDARTADEIDRAFERAQQERVGAITVLGSPFFAGFRQQIISLAARYRLPALYPAITWAEAGGLMAYGPDVDRAGWTLMAIMADRILKGAKPAELPFEQITKIDLVINAKTARALGLTIPPSILTRAEVVQ